MKKDNITKEYKKQFYIKNKLNFIIAFTEVLFVTAISLLISWLLQQIIDLIAGNNKTFELYQLTIIAISTLALGVVAYMISYFSKPKFITRGISQYKEFIFESNHIDWLWIFFV